MTEIQQRADALVALITRRQAFQQHAAVLDGFRRQAEVVMAEAARLAPLLETWHLFVRRSIGDTSAPPDVSSLSADVNQLLTRFRSDKAYVLGPNRLTAVKSGVPVFAVGLEQRLQAIWRGYVAVRAPRVNPDVLNVLSTIGPLKTDIARVTAALRALDVEAARLPMTDADVDRFDAKAEAVQAMWDAFDTGHLPPDVLQFLKDAGGSAGASIAALTDGVRAWLQSNDLSASFRVRQSLS